MENIRIDNVSRVITFDIPDLQVTAGNVYYPCGMDRETKASREEFSAKILPELLLNSLQYSCVGGDWNCIIAKRDASHNPEIKISQSLRNLV